MKLGRENIPHVPKPLLEEIVFPLLVLGNDIDIVLDPNCGEGDVVILILFPEWNNENEFVKDRPELEGWGIG